MGRWQLHIIHSCEIGVNFMQWNAMRLFQHLLVRAIIFQRVAVMIGVVGIAKFNVIGPHCFQCLVHELDLLALRGTL